MKDYGSELGNAVWVILAFIVAAPLFLIAPIVLLFFVSAALILFGAKKLQRFAAATRWPKVPGRLLQTEIGRYRVSERQYSPPTEYFFPLAYFSYHHKGSERTSNVYALDRESIWNTDPESVKAVIASIEDQESLGVYVNPDQPNEAVLSIEVSAKRRSHYWSLIVAGCLLACIGAFFTWLHS